MNRYPNLSEAEMLDLNTTLGDYIEEKYLEAQKSARQRPKTTSDNVAKAIFFLTKDLDMPTSMVKANTID